MARRSLPNVAIHALEDVYDLLDLVEHDLQLIADRQLPRDEVRIRGQRALTNLTRIRVVVVGVRPEVARNRARHRQPIEQREEQNHV